MNPDQNQAKKSFGPVIGIVVIVIVLVIGAFYIWGGKANKAPAPVPAAPATTTASNDLGALETDLSASDTQVDVSGLDSLQ